MTAAALSGQEKSSTKSSASASTSYQQALQRLASHQEQLLLLWNQHADASFAERDWKAKLVKQPESFSIRMELEEKVKSTAEIRKSINQLTGETMAIRSLLDTFYENTHPHHFQPVDLAVNANSGTTTATQSSCMKQIKLLSSIHAAAAAASPHMAAVKNSSTNLKLQAAGISSASFSSSSSASLSNSSLNSDQHSYMNSKNLMQLPPFSSSSSSSSLTSNGVHRRQSNLANGDSTSVITRNRMNEAENDDDNEEGDDDDDDEYLPDSDDSLGQIIKSCELDPKLFGKPNRSLGTTSSFKNRRISTTTGKSSSAITATTATTPTTSSSLPVVEAVSLHQLPSSFLNFNRLPLTPTTTSTSSATSTTTTEIKSTTRKRKTAPDGPSHTTRGDEDDVVHPAVMEGVEVSRGDGGHRDDLHSVDMQISDDEVDEKFGDKLITTSGTFQLKTCTNPTTTTITNDHPRHQFQNLHDDTAERSIVFSNLNDKTDNVLDIIGSNSSSSTTTTTTTATATAALPTSTQQQQQPSSTLIPPPSGHQQIIESLRLNQLALDRKEKEKDDMKEKVEIQKLPPISSSSSVSVRSFPPVTAKSETFKSAQVFNNTSAGGTSGVGAGREGSKNSQASTTVPASASISPSTSSTSRSPPSSVFVQANSSAFLSSSSLASISQRPHQHNPIPRPLLPTSSAAATSATSNTPLNTPLTPSLQISSSSSSSSKFLSSTRPFKLGGNSSELMALPAATSNRRRSSLESLPPSSSSTFPPSSLSYTNTGSTAASGGTIQINLGRSMMNMGGNNNNNNVFSQSFLQPATSTSSSSGTGMSTIISRSASTPATVGKITTPAPTTTTTTTARTEWEIYQASMAGMFDEDDSD